MKTYCTCGLKLEERCVACSLELQSEVAIADLLFIFTEEDFDWHVVVVSRDYSISSDMHNTSQQCMFTSLMTPDSLDTDGRPFATILISSALLSPFGPFWLDLGQPHATTAKFLQKQNNTFFFVCLLSNFRFVSHSFENLSLGQVRKK